MEQPIPLSDSAWQAYLNEEDRRARKEYFAQVKEALLRDDPWQTDVNGKTLTLENAVEFPLFFRYSSRDRAFYQFYNPDEITWIDNFAGVMKGTFFEDFNRLLKGGEAEAINGTKPSTKAWIISNEQGVPSDVREIDVEEWDNVLRFSYLDDGSKVEVKPSVVLNDTAQKDLDETILSNTRVESVELGVKEILGIAKEVFTDRPYEKAKILYNLSQIPIRLEYNYHNRRIIGRSGYTMIAATGCGFYQPNYKSFIGRESNGDRYYAAIKHLEKAFAGWAGATSAIFEWPVIFKGRLMGGLYTSVTYSADDGIPLSKQQILKVFGVLHRYGSFLSKDIHRFYQSMFAEEVTRSILKEKKDFVRTVKDAIHWVSNVVPREVSIIEPTMLNSDGFPQRKKKWNDMLDRHQPLKGVKNDNSGDWLVPIEYTPSSGAGRELWGAIKFPVEYKILFEKYREDPVLLVEALRTAIPAADMYRMIKEQAGSVVLIESYAHNIGAHALPGIKDKLNDLWKPGPTEKLTSLRKRVALVNRLDEALPNNMRMVGQGLVDHYQFQQYISYLEGKSLFWNAASRGGTLVGGEISTVWDLIDMFMMNNLLSYGLVASEKYVGIDYFVHYNGATHYFGRSDKEDVKIPNLTQGEDINSYKARVHKTPLNPSRLKKLDQVRKALDSLSIYLPEGVVAQQAVYTLWENVIRNVRHCSKKKRESVPFHIYVKETGDNKKYAVTVWVDLPPQDQRRVEKEIQAMEGWRGLLDQDGNPNLGGTSQNVLCAGMALGYDFLSSESSWKDIIKFKLSKNVVRTTFYLWKGADVIRAAELPQVKRGEPLGRYRLVATRKEHENYLALTQGPIRRVREKSVADSFSSLYESWIRDFVLKYENKKSQSIRIEYPNATMESLRFGDGGWQEFYDEDEKVDFLFEHVREDNVRDLSSSTIHFRSHAVMWKFIEGYVSGSQRPADFEQKRSILFSELLEVLKIRIDIVDGRLHTSFKNFSDETSSKHLGVFAYPEDGEVVTNLQMRKHFLVIHLSFIEKLVGEKNTKAIAGFVSDYASPIGLYDYVVITTGRGRNWRSGVKRDHIQNSRKLRAIPIENFEKCFQYASRCEPATPSFGLKWLLVKTIMGS